MANAPVTTRVDGPIEPVRPDDLRPEGKGLAGRIADVASHGPLYVILVLIGIFWMLPAIGLLVASLRTAAANADSGWWTALGNPSQLTLDNYQSLLANPVIQRAFINTVLITVPATLLVLFFAAMAGYAFAWIRFPGRDVLFLVVIGLLVVPLQLGLIPIARLYNQLGIFGSIVGVVLFHVGFGLPFAIFLLRNFFAGIPRELMEAARMDGASEWRLFFRVVLPLGIPALAALAVYQFLWTWNDLLVGLVFANSNSQPITVAIREQTRQFGANIDIISSGAFLSMVIPLIVFFAFQRYFVRGLLAGSGK
ncbi:MAG: carbohydrate ABC transporter permease [Acidimicrobiia bacterium]|nr:carbohydrate ABC transporter permease [Acidimicrobiia bacterium]